VEEGASIDHVEGVFEVDIEEAHTLAFLPEGTPEGVSNHFHPAWASDPEVVSSERVCDR
jgi:hypothetical protein